MSTQLKKEFSPEDLQRARNIITGQTGNRTKITAGYEKKNVTRGEGDIWEENGKTWTIIDGLKQTVTKHDKIRKLVQMPLVCPSCNKPMKADKLNTKMWKLHKQCFQCQVYFETSLRCSSKPFSVIISKTVFASDIASGDPAKVEPWLPIPIELATFFVNKQPPTGYPPATALANGTISGLILEY